MNIRKKKALQYEKQYHLITKIKDLEQTLDNYMFSDRNFGSFFELLTTLKHIQHSKPRSFGGSPLDEFSTWFHSHNGNISPNIKLTSNLAEGNGFLVTGGSQVCKGDLLVSVPKEIMMYSGHPRLQPFPACFVHDPILKHFPTVELTLHLLIEKHHSSSFWQSYIQVLPGEFSLPLFWTHADFHCLNGTSVFYDGLKMVRNVVRYYSHLFKLIYQQPNPHISLDTFTFEEFCTCFSAVLTRQNHIPDLSTSEVALVPMWDCFNHSIQGSMTTQYIPESDRLECMAPETKSLNTQVYIHYGDRSNADLFLNYGFICVKNYQDRLCMPCSTILNSNSGTSLCPPETISALGSHFSTIDKVALPDEEFDLEKLLSLLQLTLPTCVYLYPKGQGKDTPPLAFYLLCFLKYTMNTNNPVLKTCFNFFINKIFQNDKRFPSTDDNYDDNPRLKTILFLFGQAFLQNLLETFQTNISLCTTNNLLRTINESEATIIRNNLSNLSPEAIKFAGSDKKKKKRKKKKKQVNKKMD